MKTRSSDHIDFPEWEYFIDASDTSDSEKEKRKIVIRWFLGWCKSQHLEVDGESIWNRFLHI